MIDVFLNYLAEHYPELALMVLTVMIFMVLAWKTRGLYERCRKVENKVMDLPCKEHGEELEKVRHLPCAQHSEKIAEHSAHHNTMDVAWAKLETSITYMQKSIDTLAKSLQNNNQIVTDPYTQAHSPLTITKEGREMIERTGMDVMFESNWERISTLVKDNVPSNNPYDIQEFCIEQAVVFPEKFLNAGQVNELKTDAYRTGIPLTSYMRVLAVLARDRYFEENGISVTDIGEKTSDK